MVVSLASSAPILDTIEYGVAAPGDIRTAARIYVENFPRQVRKWFVNNEQATDFYDDLMELMRLAYGPTFFTARSNRQLIGYLVLTLPGTQIFSALFQERFMLRALAHALTGRYAYSPLFFARILSALLAIPTSRLKNEPFAPQIYVLTVSRDYWGRGIGSALIEQASRHCSARFRRIWLYVDTDNTRAIQLYQHLGFQIVASNSMQFMMIKDFGA